jgi:nicotinate (nicotinamide) nucleotide adenylyltransferase
MQKILFYPVTCNPPHIGHISAINTAIRSIDFDEIWIMPSGKRVDKEITTHTEDRKKLGKILVECVQKGINIPVKLISTAIDNIDIKYSHEVIVELKSNSADDIYQLAGTDGFTSIKERVIGPNEKFIIIKRSGYEFPENLILNKNLIILNEEARVAGISSTKIREMVKNGDKSYKDLVPEEVSEYIDENGLYL